MHPLHDYLCEQLNARLRRRSIVVFYDPRGEFLPFFDRELVPSGVGYGGLPRVFLGDDLAFLARYDGSLLALRAAIEPLTCGDQPERLVVYLPGLARDRLGSVLMEVEKGGDCYEPQLKRLAMNVLRQHFSDGQIDDLLRPTTVGWDDIVAFLKQGTGSVLRSLFDGLQAEALLARWIGDEAHDRAIVDRGATGELYRLVATRLGLALPDDTPLSEARDRVARYILVNEFRADLSGPPPASIGRIPETPNREFLERVRNLARALRQDTWERYAALADRVESELSLATAGLPAVSLGSVDTFRFEERVLLVHAGDLIGGRRYAEAIEVIQQRADNAWLRHDMLRQAQWEACCRMAELGLEVEKASRSLARITGDPTSWVKAYADPDKGWYRADLAQRRLESFVAQMGEDAEPEAALAAVRALHDDLVRRMADGFARALADAHWTVPGVLHQTRIYPEVVRPAQGPVAWFWVDAMRFEMGMDLARQIQGVLDLSVRPAIAAMPTITPVGMAALLPGASASFSVVDGGGRPAAVIEGVQLPGLTERLRLLDAKVPDVVEMKIDKVIQTRRDRLQKAIGNKSLVVVRSQDIDSVGEADSDFVARQVLDNIVGNLARAVRKLADVGVERFVLTADHGHLFGTRREEDMRADSPGGDTVGLHRRCWFGRGGSTPPGTVRIPGADLGYATDLDFVFPTGVSVFRSGGSPSFHHGGFSLQELVIPVVSFRIPSRAARPAATRKVTLAGVPERLTNRTFGVRVTVASELLETEPVALRVILVCHNEQVGQVGMAVGGAFDRKTGIVAVAPGQEASLGLMLNRDDCDLVRILVLDPGSDAVLDQSEDIPVKLGI